MGTRSLIHIKQDGETLVTLYRQYDGYPTGMGKDIIDALAKGKARLVNGYSGKDKSPEVFNGMGCLAAYLVGALKKPHDMGGGNSIGNVYLYPPNSSNCGEEYVYTIENAKPKGEESDRKPGVITLTVKGVYSDKTLYSGPLAKFNPKKAEQTGESEE
jgi:L-2-hydroxyglutarate oxidase LhgO